MITPEWSPDGLHMVFCTVVDSGGGAAIGANYSADKPRQADIWMVDAEGRNRVNLTQSQFTNLQPVWASDGTIYFTSNRSLGEVENVWALRPDRALNVMTQARATATNPAAAQKPAAYPGYTQYPGDSGQSDAVSGAATAAVPVN